MIDRVRQLLLPALMVLATAAAEAQTCNPWTLDYGDRQSDLVVQPLFDSDNRLVLHAKNVGRQRISGFRDGAHILLTLWEDGRLIDRELESAGFTFNGLDPNLDMFSLPLRAGPFTHYEWDIRVRTVKPDILGFPVQVANTSPDTIPWGACPEDLDTTAPTVTITSTASAPVSGPFPITVTFSEPVTGFELPNLVVGNGSASELQENEASYTATVTPTASGAVTVDIAAGAAEDSAGNPSAAADQFSITADLTPVDTTAPTVTITSTASAPVSGPFPITVTFSEPVTGFELPDLVVGNGSASELQGNKASYTATVTPTALGAVTVDIAAGAAEDSAGNPSAAADQFSITADLTPVPALPLAGAGALAALLLIGGIRRRRGVLTTYRETHGDH